MINLRAALQTALAAMLVCTSLGAQSVELLSTQKIWDQGGHNAFTDLIRFGDQWHCVFREADGHVRGNGALRVIRSVDGERWESAALIAESGIDLRDPKISLTPDGRLMMVAGGSVYREGKLVGRQPRVTFSSDGLTWEQPQRILSEGHWLWRVTWRQQVAYGASYFIDSADDEEWRLDLVKSTDGINYQTIGELDIDGRPNETTLRFRDDDSVIALVRREAGSKNGWIGEASPPYTSWSWKEIDHRLGGPDFIILSDGAMWAGTRQYGDAATTMLARMTTTSLTPVLTLPSGGDTSYPGFVWHDDILWMSYYASHEEKTSIYLARIRLLK